MSNGTFGPGDPSFEDEFNRDDANPFITGPAHSEGPNAYGPVEPLPGITSGAPRYGQDTSQRAWQQRQATKIPAYGPSFAERLETMRPSDPGADPRMSTETPARRLRGPAGGGVLPGGFDRSLPGLTPDTTDQFSKWRWKDKPGDQNI